MNQIVTRLAMKSILNIEKGTYPVGNGVFKSALVGLFVNNADLTPDTLFSDLEEPGDAGSYARVAVATWLGPYLDPGPDWSIYSGTVASFSGLAVSASPGIPVYGWFLLSSDEETLLAATKFDEPIDWLSLDQVILISPTLILPGTSIETPQANG